MQALPEDIDKYRANTTPATSRSGEARFEREKKLGLIDPTWDLSPQVGEWDKVKNKAWEARGMEVYAAMLDRMDQNIGRIVQTLQQTGKQLDNTLVLYLQDNGGNYEPFGRDSKENPRQADHADAAEVAGRRCIQTGDAAETDARRLARAGRARRACPARPTPTSPTARRWANVSNTPVPRVQAFRPRGRHRHAADRPLAGGHLAQGRAGEAARPPDRPDGDLRRPGRGRRTRSSSTVSDDLRRWKASACVPAFDGQRCSGRSLFWEHEGNRAMRQGEWKLVAKAPAGKWELYDMARDRTEMHDLASVEPDRLQSMAGEWEAWAKRCHVLPWPWKPQYGKEGEKK